MTKKVTKKKAAPRKKTAKKTEATYTKHVVDVEIPRAPEPGRVSVTIGCNLDYGKAKYEINTSQTMKPGEATDVALARVQNELEAYMDANGYDVLQSMKKLSTKAGKNSREA